MWKTISDETLESTVGLSSWAVGWIQYNTALCVYGSSLMHAYLRQKQSSVKMYAVHIRTWGKQLFWTDESLTSCMKILLLDWRLVFVSVWSYLFLQALQNLVSGCQKSLLVKTSHVSNCLLLLQFSARKMPWASGRWAQQGKHILRSKERLESFPSCPFAQLPPHLVHFIFPILEKRAFVYAQNQWSQQAFKVTAKKIRKIAVESKSDTSW